MDVPHFCRLLLGSSVGVGCLGQLLSCNGQVWIIVANVHMNCNVMWSMGVSWTVELLNWICLDHIWKHYLAIVKTIANIESFSSTARWLCKFALPLDRWRSDVIQTQQKYLRLVDSENYLHLMEQKRIESRKHLQILSAHWRHATSRPDVCGYYGGLGTTNIWLALFLKNSHGEFYNMLWFNNNRKNCLM